MLNKIFRVLKYYKKTRFIGLKKIMLYNYYEDDFDGTVDNKEYTKLVNIVKKLSSQSDRRTIVEIGSLFGLSAQALLEGNDDSVVYCIDNFKWNPIGLSSKRHEMMLKNNLRYFINKGRVTVLKGSSTNISVDEIKGEVLLTFIDGDHSYEAVKNDINFAVSLKSDFICGDDYHFEGVKKAVNEIFGQSNFEVFNNTMWIYNSNSN